VIKKIEGVSSVLWLANSTHNQKFVGLNLVSSKILYGNGVKVMPGSIPARNSSSFENKNKNKGNQMGHTKIHYFKEKK
jgi:hypothetical protein